MKKKIILELTPRQSLGLFQILEQHKIFQSQTPRKNWQLSRIRGEIEKNLWKKATDIKAIADLPD